MTTLTQESKNNFVGMNKDTIVSNKQITHAMNALLESHDGDVGIITTENSNQVAFTLSANQYPIGYISMANNEGALITTDESVAQIHLIKDKNIIVTYNINGLDLSRTHLIQGTFKIHKGCERVIYWNDNHRNPDRYFNFDDIDAFKTAAVFDPVKFKILPDKTNIGVEVQQVNNTGGSLELGQYFFQVDVLDSNQKVVYSSLLSNSVIIYDESQNLDYNQIDGGYNYPQFTAENGGVISTNKSITLRFSNVGTKYSYLQLKVLKYTSGDGVTKSAHKVAEMIPITNNILNYTYKGYNTTNGDIAIDSSDLTTLDSSIESSSYMEQVQNRLLRGNVREKTIDYSTFQSFANQIQSKYVIKETSFKDADVLGNAKNPLTYQSTTGYMADEVYAFGIVYVFNDGNISPVFHIPGRASVASDTVNLIVNTDVPLDNVLHVNSTAVTGSLIPTWKLKNTANTTTRVMAYYEDEQEVYPNTQDCNGNAIWGTLSGQKIRHHKFPDRQQVPLVSSLNNLNVLGVEFTNVTYPTNVVSHFFVKATRDDLNKTVLDTGYASTQFSQGVAPAVTVINYDNSTHVAGANDITTFVSPKTYLTKEYLNGSYVRSLFTMNEPVSPEGYRGLELPTPADVTNGFVNYAQCTRQYFGVNYYNSAKITNTAPLTNSMLINKSGYINPTSTSNSNIFPIVNQNFLTSIFTIDTNVPVLNSSIPFRRAYASVKVYKSVYSNLFNLTYERIGNIGQNICYNGDVFLSTTPIVFGQYEKVNLPNSTTTLSNISGSFYIDLIFESEVNAGLRHGGLDDCSKYYSNNRYADEAIRQSGSHPVNIPISSGDMSEYLRNKYMTEASPTDLVKNTFCTEYTKYNIDYNKISNPQIFFPVENSFDYCSNCLNEYSQRLVYSEKSFTEEKQDAYLVFKTNNYVDLPANKGSITGLKYKNGMLLVHTTNSTFILKPNPQVLITNQSDVYLGTGDFLSIPAQELLQTDLGYAGCQSRHAMINTPYGYCWADEKAGQVFMFETSLEDISQIGMTKWFSENLPIKNLSISNTNNDNAYFGNGTVLSYDPTHKRLLLVKSNYKNLSLSETLSWNGVNIVNGSNVVKTLGDVGNFENKSFTASYSFVFKSWTSFHSYLPTFIWYNEDTFFTNDKNKFGGSNLNIYSHDNKIEFRTYYGDVKPFIVEYVNWDYLTKELESVNYIAQTKSWNSTNNVWVIDTTKTFNKLWCYTKEQSTGLLTLTQLNQQTNPFGNIAFNFTNKNVLRTDKNYKVNSIYVNKLNSPVKTNNWINTQSSYPIDFVPVTNDSIQQVNLQKLKDKECYVRLIHDDVFIQNKIVLYLTNNDSNISIR